MTSYALLSFVLRGQEEAALPVVRWLTAKRNSQGGWSSTQDTVMALMALGAYGEKAYKPNFDVSIKLSNRRSKQKTYRVNPKNALILQTFRVRTESYSSNQDVGASDARSRTRIIVIMAR